MKSWTKLLPFFIVKAMAKGTCEVLASENGKRYVMPYKDVLIFFKAPKRKESGSGE